MTATPTTARQRTITVRALVLGTALAAGLTGCGGGDGDKPSDGESPMGAIDKMFEEAYADWDEETSNQQQMQVEELVAECMAGLGFEYIPVDYSAMNAGMSISTDDEIPWGTLEFAEQWGYGITTNPWEDSEESPEPLPGDEFVDPNQAITEKMSETELNAYYAALWGEQSMEPTEDGEYVEPSWEEMGCFGSAQHEIYGDSAFGAGEDDPFASLMEEMNTMWESVSTDDRILATEAEWASCMADAGHPNLAKVGDAEQEIYSQVDPIWNDAYSDMPPDATEEDYRAVEQSIQDQLAAITPQEIELAVADYTCRDESGYDDVYSEVNLDLQQKFYDEHKAELEEWIAYQKEQQG
ncbi:hypothetical protein [Actinotalea fermentans]|uniref:ABC transporter substrate-binding protein n=1 Tax=Actinotalea fermentans TaxID=43671 RepID=A0A511YZP1_9CELL|nr:hypothetical protein [Actinotalea fermentans]KGM16644.1 hypothetical protein N867_17710 [Actinotalea fermentans ATCC 43279 = JCM 9966 = DSM 3133]GEN80684.1 hypothetical protein AFE02nite_24180 [Actinotalea fermentans]